jgi:hypothetical protein
MLSAAFCAADMDDNGRLDCDDFCVFAQVLLQSPLGCGVPPENDDCPNAILMSTGVQYSGNTGFATRDGPHIICEDGCGTGCDRAPDVWYRWVGDFTGPANFSMCTLPGFDSILAVYDACPTMGGVQLACNDDACVTRSLLCNYGVSTGQSYWIRVSGWGGDKGCFTFRIYPATSCP